MRTALPNANDIAFTGMPLLRSKILTNAYHKYNRLSSHMPTSNKCNKEGNLLKDKKLAKKKKKALDKVIGTMNLKENRTPLGWIKFGLRCLMYIVSSAICFVFFLVSYIMILYFIKTVLFKNHDIDMRMLVSKPVLCILFLLVTGLLTYVKIRRKEFGIMSEGKKRQLIRDGASKTFVERGVRKFERKLHFVRFLDLTALLAVLIIIILYVTSKENGLGETMETAVVFLAIYAGSSLYLPPFLFVIPYVFNTIPSIEISGAMYNVLDRPANPISWMCVSLVIAKVAFSYKKEYKAELEGAMEKYISELSEREEEETWYDL